MKKKIILKTNTAYLLNDWLKEPTIWKEARKFIEEKHEEHWNKLNNGFVKVTFEIEKELAGVKE